LEFERLLRIKWAVLFGRGTKLRTLSSEHSGLIDRKREILVVFMAGMIIMFFCPAKGSYGWGKTWMGYDLEQQIKAADLELGPFKIRTILYLTNAGYDSNVYRTPNNPVKDFSMTVGPGFFIYLPIKKKIVISVYESPQYVYFVETKKERTWNNFFNGQVHFVLNRFFISLGKGYSVAREIWNTEIDIRPQRKEDSSEGSLLWQISKKTSLFLKFSQAKYRYEDLSFGGSRIDYTLNRTENRANLTGYYRVSFRTMFFMNFQYGQYKFQYALNPRDSKSYGVYSGLEFSPLGVFRGRINLGYKYFDVLVVGIRDYQGMVGDTGLSIRVVRPLTIRANYKREVQFSVWYDNAYYLENILGGGTSLYLSKNIRLDYRYNLGKNNYPATILKQSSPQRREDKYRSQSAGLYFRIKKKLGLGVTVTQWDRDSSVYWANGKQTMVGINLIHDF
jgi:hypothetical protein